MYELLKTFPYSIQVSIVLIPVVSLLIGVIAFVINVRQTILNNKLVRAKMVSDSLHTFMDDATIQSAFYKIEYDEFKYGHQFHGSNEEKEIDKLLRHFSNLAMMWKVGLLELNDIYPIQYFILRTTRNKNVQQYLNFIDDWSNRVGTGGHPYADLNELSKKLELDETSQ